MAPSVWNLMQSSPSPDLFLASLGQSEQNMISNWRAKRNILIQEKARKDISKYVENETNLFRKCTRFVQIRVKTWSNKDIGDLEDIEHKNDEAMLTIWEPSEEQMNMISEGNVIQFRNLSVKSQSAGPSQLLHLSARPNATAMTKLDPQPSSDSIQACGYEPREFRTLLRPYLASKKLALNASIDAEYDCGGILIKAEKANSRIFIYILDEMKYLLRIERTIDNDMNVLSASIFHWMQNILDTPPGTSLYFKNIRILPFDEIENCTVGLWTETSVQDTTYSERDEILRTWYDDQSGYEECILAAERLSAGIPSHPSLQAIYGEIRRIKLHPIHIKNSGSHEGQNRFTLREFPWILEIQDQNGNIMEAILPTKLLSTFSSQNDMNIRPKSSPDFCQMMTMEQILDEIKMISHHFETTLSIMYFLLEKDNNMIILLNEIDAEKAALTL